MGEVLRGDTDHDLAMSKTDGLVETDVVYSLSHAPLIRSNYLPSHNCVPIFWFLSLKNQVLKVMKM